MRILCSFSPGSYGILLLQDFFFFLWLLWWDRVPTMDNLMKRGFIGANWCCMRNSAGCQRNQLWDRLICPLNVC